MVICASYRWFLWCIYLYHSGSLHWHWGNHMIAPNASEVTLNRMGKINHYQIIPKHNKVRNHFDMYMLHVYWLPAWWASGFFSGDHQQNHQCLWFPSCNIVTLDIVLNCLNPGIKLLLLLLLLHHVMIKHAFYKLTMASYYLKHHLNDQIT